MTIAICIEIIKNHTYADKASEYSHWKVCRSTN